MSLREAIRADERPTGYKGAIEALLESVPDVERSEILDVLGDRSLSSTRIAAAMNKEYGPVLIRPVTAQMVRNWRQKAGGV